ncbi:MAG: hypothetical protein HZA01_08445 [Nitrospinae bacterium]|nr:hypothetical protein [Nitrospinota bacterium]
MAGKQIRLEIKGEDTLLDKNLVELIEDPLVPILRNSIDHGIEASDGERSKAGKPAEGRISISASADKEWARIIHRG